MEPRYHKSVKSYAPVNRLRWISVCKMFTGQHCQKQPLLLLKNTGLDKERIYFVFQFQQRPQPIPWNFWSFRLKSLCTLWCAIWWECKLVQPLWKTVWKFLWIFTECGLSYSITTETSKEIQSSRTVHHLKKKKKRVTSLVVQLSRIRAPMQRPWVQSLIWEDFTGQAANKLACLEPMLDEERSYYHDKPTHSN